MPEIGMLYRGEDAQITSYLERAVTSELSGNLADVCPVGALLQKPQSFESRPWELRKVPAIDVMDAVGSNIRLDVRQRQVMRVAPAHQRRRQRGVDLGQDAPPCRCAGPRPARPAVGAREGQAARGELERGARGVRRAAEEGRARTSRRSPAICSMPRRCMRPRRCSKGRGRACSKGARPASIMTSSSLSAVAFNSTIAGIENADAVLLVGIEHPLGSAADQHPAAQGARKGGARCSRIGPEVDLGMQVDWLGDDLKLLGKLPKAVADAFAGAERPAVIVGPGALGGGRAGRGARRWSSRSSSSGTAGTASTSSTPPPRAWPG